MQSNLSIYLRGLKRLILCKNPIYLLLFVLVFFSQFRIDAQTVNAAKQKSPAVKRDSICLIISVGTAGFEPATLCL